MNNLQLNASVSQLADAIEYELKHFAFTERATGLRDAQEYVRRAWHALDGSPCKDEETESEERKAVQ